MLCPQVFNRINRLTGPLQVDLFASSLSTSYKIMSLDTRSRGNGNGCLHPQLDKVPRICKPRLKSGGKNANADKAAESTPSSSGTCLEVPSMVPTLLGMLTHESLLLPNLSGLIQPTHRVSKPDMQCNPSTSCMGYLKDRFQDQKVSEEASKLLLTSWRQIQRRRMTPCLTSGWVGVTNGIAIPFQVI